MSVFLPEIFFLTLKLLFTYGMTHAIISFIKRVIRAIQMPHSWAEDEEERPLMRKFGELESSWYDYKHEFEYRHDQLLEKLNKLIPALPETTTVAEEYCMEKAKKRRKRLDPDAQ